MGRITKAGEQAVLIILSFLGTYGVCYLLELTGSRYPDYSVMSVFLAGGIYGLLKRISGGRTRRRFLYGAAVSFFSFRPVRLSSPRLMERRKLR